MTVYVKREGRPSESEQVVKLRDRIAALERALEAEMALNMEMQLENAALWAFVRAMRNFDMRALMRADDALRQYEEKP
jgi:hypothetical protein